MTRLEEIVSQLENGEHTLEDALSCMRGVKADEAMCEHAG